MPSTFIPRPTWGRGMGSAPKAWEGEGPLNLKAPAKKMERSACSWPLAVEKSILKEMAEGHEDKAQRF